MTDKVEAMPIPAELPRERRVIDAVAMFMVALISLVLLIYVAYGEAKRTYEQFQIDKLVAQGQVIQSAVEGFVRPGLPIHQFVGFNGLAEPMVKADPLIDAISAYDVNGRRVFVSGEQKGDLLPADSDTTTYIKDKNAEIRRSGDILQVIVPVRNRFEQVGYVMMSIPRAKVAEQVEIAFRPVIYIGLAAAFGFAFFVYIFSPRFPPSERRQWIAGGFVISFIAVAVVVVSTLVSVYSQGAQARTKSLADSLGLRLDDLVIMNINLDDVTGIIALFGDYKRLNPDLPISIPIGAEPTGTGSNPITNTLCGCLRIIHRAKFW
jgi:hypothetical protein